MSSSKWDISTRPLPVRFTKESIKRKRRRKIRRRRKRKRERKKKEKKKSLVYDENNSNRTNE